MATTYTITADSIPVYKAWFWSDSWGCAEWIQYFNALVAKYGQSDAEIKWSNAWLQGVDKANGGFGTAVGSGYITDSVPLDCRSFDSNFKAFLEANPNLKSTVFEGIGGWFGKVISAGTTVVDAAGNIIGNTATGISNFTKTFKWLIPTLVIVAVLGAVIFFGKKYNVFSAQVSKYMAYGLIVIAIITGVVFYKKNQTA